MDLIVAAANLGNAIRDGFLLPGREILALLESVVPAVSGWNDSFVMANIDGLPLLVSLAFWVFAGLSLYLIFRRLRRLFREFIDGLRLRLRLLLIRIGRPFRRIVEIRRAWHAQKAVSSESIELDKLDIAVLKIASARSPTLAVCAPDLVEHLHCRPTAIQRRLNRLSQYRLLESAEGSSGGFAHYTLTPAGAAYSRSLV